MLPPTADEMRGAVREPVDVRADFPSVVLLVTDPLDVHQYPERPFSRFTAHTTSNAILQIERTIPDLIVIDCDFPDVDAELVCRLASARVLVTTAEPGRAPAAIKAGCDAVLLKPFAPNLAAARIGRLLRGDAGMQGMAGARDGQPGTNRIWTDEVCERCGTSGATSFEFSSYRRSWYACLACDSVWLGARRE